MKKLLKEWVIVLVLCAVMMMLLKVFTAAAVIVMTICTGLTLSRLAAWLAK
jgi:hypothetical protein